MSSLLVCIRIPQQIPILPPHSRYLQPERKPIRVEAARHRHSRNADPIHPPCLAVRTSLGSARNGLVIRRNLQRRVHKPIDPPSLPRLLVHLHSRPLPSPTAPLPPKLTL